MDAARGAWLGLAGLVALAVFAVPRVVPAVRASYQRVLDAFEYVGETEAEALARFRSPDYVAALDRVKATIPRDAAYYLVPADGEEGNMVFVRFDLAPRKPEKLDLAVSVDPVSPGAPQWVVLSRIESPGPEVVETAEYFRAEAPR